VPEYWIVDLEVASVEVLRLAERAETADVVPSNGSFSWAPVSGGPTLEVAVADVLEGV
jgi:Uma2 family endonuclease